MTDSVNGTAPMDDDDVFEGSSDDFAAKEDMKDRLVMIYPTGGKGYFPPKAPGAKQDVWYDTITVVLDDGVDADGKPMEWSPTTIDKNGNQRENLIPSVAEFGPQTVPYRWSTTGATSRLAKKLPELNNGVPVGLLGRVNKGKATGGNNAPWRPNPPTEADKALAVQPEMKAARLAARDEIMASLKAAEAEDAF